MSFELILSHEQPGKQKTKPVSSITAPDSAEAKILEGGDPLQVERRDDIHDALTAVNCLQ